MNKPRLMLGLKAFGIHFAFSCIIAGIVFFLIVEKFFPWPFGELVGGLRLMAILMIVDVVCGPLLTAIVFNPSKSAKERWFDVSIILLLQIAALLYGLYAIERARPVVLAFETDRFVAVSVGQIDESKLSEAPDDLGRLSWSGPRLVGTRDPKDGKETFASIEMSIQGVEPSTRPGWWQDYEKSRPVVKERMKKLSVLSIENSNISSAKLNLYVQKTGMNINSIYYMPLVSHKNLDAWIVLLNEDADVVGYAPFGGF